MKTPVILALRLTGLLVCTTPTPNSLWQDRRWYEYTGTTFEQMQGWGWQSVHDPELLPEVMARYSQCLATGEPFDMDFPLRGVDGCFRSFLTRALPVRDSAGNIVRWFGRRIGGNWVPGEEQPLISCKLVFWPLLQFAGANLSCINFIKE